MKGKENKKENKKTKSDGLTAKVQSDYQKEKTKQSVPDSMVCKPKKK